jgi:hypothetical protein
MKPLALGPSYCLIPGHHPAFSWVPSDHTNVAETFRRAREHYFPINPHRVGDDYDHVERTAYLDSPGDFK